MLDETRYHWRERHIGWRDVARNLMLTTASAVALAAALTAIEAVRPHHPRSADLARPAAVQVVSGSVVRQRWQ